MANKHIPINITNFEGDHELLPFFFDQIRSVAEINKYNQQTTISLLKSKLTGPALKFFCQNPELLKSNDLDFIEKEFSAFFSPPSKCAASIELSGLTLLPAETIKNFAHRLNVLAATVYADITDKNAHDKIKFMKFLEAIPSNLRIKIQEEGIYDYKTAVDRAQVLHEILHTEKVLHAYPSTSKSDIGLAEQLREISEKINVLSLKSDNKQAEENVNVRPDFKQKYRLDAMRHKKNFKSRHNFKRFSPHKSFKRNITTCQLCFKKGHEAHSCFKWKRMNTQRREQFRNFSNNNQQKSQEN